MKTPPVIVEKDVDNSMKDGRVPIAKGIDGLDIKGKGVVIIVEGTGVCFVDGVKIEETGCGTNRITRR